MAEILLVKRGGMFFPADDTSAAVCRKVAHGEVLKGNFVRPRNVRFHRKFFALLQVAYDVWEPNTEHKGEPMGKNFESFRKDIVILTGRRRVVASLNGAGVRYEADSIAFHAMDDDEFERLYSDTIDVILRHILADWDREGVEQAVEQVLRFAA